MWIQEEPLSFIKEYLDHLQVELKQLCNFHELSVIQRMWLGFCLMGILLTNTICWAKFERMSFKRYTQQALSWMFRHSKMPWDKLLMASISSLLKKFGIQEGVLILDDKDISRSKNAKKLFRLHKIKDKKTGGYFLGQNIVMLYFVTRQFCIPAGFAFYSPDPDFKKWKEEIANLKKRKVDKQQWPKRPERSPDHPKKYELAIQLAGNFKAHFPHIKIQAVLADALYGHLPFIQGIERLWDDTQIITKMRNNQRVAYGNKPYSCESYAQSYANWQQEVVIRGRDQKTILTGGGRLYVPSHETKRFVIAIKYAGEAKYRYLMATKLSWNMKMIIEAFSLRWLIEVFFEDWSCYHGFCSLAKQCGIEGSLRPLILSLLFDHCFFFHAIQTISLKNECSLATFGTLLERIRSEALCHFIRQILDDESPKAKLQELVDHLEEVFPLRSSKKHFSGTYIDLGMNKNVA